MEGCPATRTPTRHPPTPLGKRSAFPTAHPPRRRQEGDISIEFYQGTFLTSLDIGEECSSPLLEGPASDRIRLAPMTATEPNPEPSAKNIRRALARRFPRARKTYNWVMDRTIRLVWNGIRKTPSTVAWTSETLGTLLRYRRENRLTVAVDIAAFWEPLTGIGWYLYRLLEHLADRDDVRLLLFSPTIIRSPNLEGPTVPVPEGKALETVHYDISPRKVLFAGTLTRLLRRFEAHLVRSQLLLAATILLGARFAGCNDPRPGVS